jgi:hypothetical protein
MWCIQEITPEFRERMYDILDLYAEPYDPRRPVIGLDEKPKQLVEDSRKSIPLKKGKATKQDYEYVHKGTANIFVAVEPKGGKRVTQVTDQRTRKDFAFFLRMLVKKYADAECIRIVLDNLNTHNEKSLFENFWKEQADEILSKVEFHFTPKHASWLNVAEIEIGVMDTECTRRRIKDMKMLTQEVRAWTMRRNRQRKKINWAFTKQKADRKLSKYYVS